MKAILALILVLACGAARLAAEASVGAGDSPGSTVSTVDSYLSESDVVSALGDGAMDNCFLKTLKLKSIEVCPVDFIPFELMCIRYDMNTPMAMIEGSDRQGHLSIDSEQLEDHMEDLNQNMSPMEKTMVQRVGDFASASNTTQGRCINMFLTASIVKYIASAVSFESLCSPLYEFTRVPYGYAFASEGDHQNGTEFGNWRGVVSAYWYVPWLTPFTAISRVMETPGLCAVDYYKVFCHGGWGTVYPSAGVNPAESQGLGLVDSAYDALNPTYGVFMLYGPLHLRMGGPLVTAAHASSSYTYGDSAMHAMLTRGGYIQPLWPTKKSSCIDTSDVSNDIDGDMELWMPQVGSKPIAETNSNALSDGPKFSDKDRNVAGALWPRFTCCMWCIPSSDTAEKHFDVGNGYLPQLISGD
jgi:hypothetical protein